MGFARKRMMEGAALLVSAAIWWPLMHFFWKPALPASGELDPLAIPMARHLEDLWGDVIQGKDSVDAMREVNPEWDFMGRTFFVLGQANLALRVVGRKEKCLAVIDPLIRDTIDREAAHGMEHYLMPYHNARPWVEQPPRSIFVDGEIALCIGARRFVEDDPQWKNEFGNRIEQIVDRMSRGPLLCAESYPDECWMFCNAAAIAALRMAEVLDGTDHTELKQGWLENVKEKLLDPDTGMLISTFHLDGRLHAAGPGPEGSTIWFAVHMLQSVDSDFAEAQYKLARKSLGRSLFGFGYSKEWPRYSLSAMDIDSGMVVPVFGASASASGLALVAAAAFEDRSFYRKLRTSLKYGAFPSVDDERATFRMAGAIGDPVIFYSTVVGPLWQKLQ